MARSENMKPWQADEEHFFACATCKGNCWNCYYADECGYWLENDWAVPTLHKDDPILSGKVN